MPQNRRKNRSLSRIELQSRQRIARPQLQLRSSASAERALADRAPELMVLADRAPELIVLPILITIGGRYGVSSSYLA